MSYIGNQPVLQTTQFREEFFPTSNQTAFTTGGFHPSAVSITRNGVLLSESDYVKGSDNVTITLNNAAVSGDVVVIKGNRSLAQGVSVSESRVEYTWQSGDTVVQLNADVIPLYTDVFLNGVKLASSDYSINASTKQVSFNGAGQTAPAVGDVIAVVHKNEASALVALPLKDSSGAEILSESGSTVALANVDTATIGSNALVVDSSGNVGVGTSPSQKLEVSGISSLGVNENDYINVRGGNGTARVEAVGSNTDVNLSLATQGSGTFYFWSGGYGGTERMRIDSSGNVGIGTTPTEKLSVNGGVVVDTNVFNKLQLLDTVNSDVPFVVSSGTGATTIGNDVNSVTGSEYIQIHSSNELRFGTSGTERMRINSSGAVSIVGSLSKGSGSFKIDHPLPEKTDTHRLVHSFVEAPQADLIYRGKVDLVDGSATVNIDTVACMTEGTFVALNREVQCFTSNESDWDAVRGSVTGNILTIECQNAESTATISWLVIGERQDQHMYDTEWTDENGKVIVEPLKEIEALEATL